MRQIIDCLDLPLIVATPGADYISLPNLTTAIRSLTADQAGEPLFVSEFPYTDASVAANIKSLAHVIVVPTIDAEVGPIGKAYVATLLPSVAKKLRELRATPGAFAEWIQTNHIGSKAAWRELDVRDLLGLLAKANKH